MKTLENTRSVECGPFIEQTQISAGLDYYKPTMSSLAWEVEPDTEVTYTFHNRGKQRIADYVDIDSLKSRFDFIRQNGFSQTEIDYLAGLQKADGSKVFKDDHLSFIAAGCLPEVNVSIDPETDDLAIDLSGPWVLATFWETIVLSEVNEAYFEAYLMANNINPMDVYEEGATRLDKKIAVLQANPDIKFADFGTRRHFSLRWHKYVLEQLKGRCPANFLGTSNVAMSASIDMKPIGTFAHEMPMVFAGLADANNEDIRSSHGQFLDSWYNALGQEYSVALTDTFGTKFFFEDFSREQAIVWKGLRQDSGDPYEFGEQAIKFYENYDIGPRSKTVVFSDGLDLDAIISLQKHFGDRLNVIFGWGTTLTNDLGVDPLNIVMKATHVRDCLSGQEADTVKLSDAPGKHTGPEQLVKRYQQIFDNHLGEAINA